MEKENGTQSWANIVAGNKLASRGMNLQYIASMIQDGEKIIKLDLEDVKFPNLPLNYWSMKALSKIGSALRNPVYANDCTIGTIRISYARMLIEMDITKPLTRRVKLQDSMRKTIEQEISYDWEPTYCNKCLQIGYNCNENIMQQPQRQAYRGRGNKVKQVWQKTEKAGPKKIIRRRSKQRRWK
uniref:DUF4283 domain-containing protein n=1 Tax=Nicotiana tabacum TaxID=4097 RepID=A0A1S3ZMI6_TOBAC|nr:PREDICTED: uncharacterized protein LOC107788589 [Nicotiana tabacum]